MSDSKEKIDAKDLYNQYKTFDKFDGQMRAARFCVAYNLPHITRIEMKDGVLYAYGQPCLDYERMKLETIVKVSDLAKVYNFDCRWYPQLAALASTSFSTADETLKVKQSLEDMLNDYHKLGFDTHSNVAKCDDELALAIRAAFKIIYSEKNNIINWSCAFGDMTLGKLSHLSFHMQEYPFIHDQSEIVPSKQLLNYWSNVFDLKDSKTLAIMLSHMTSLDLNNLIFQRPPKTNENFAVYLEFKVGEDEKLKYFCRSPGSFQRTNKPVINIPQMLDLQSFYKQKQGVIKQDTKNLLTLYLHLNNQLMGYPVYQDKRFGMMLMSLAFSQPLEDMKKMFNQTQSENRNLDLALMVGSIFDNDMNFYKLNEIYFESQIRAAREWEKEPQKHLYNELCVQHTKPDGLGVFVIAVFTNKKSNIKGANPIHNFFVVKNASTSQNPIFYFDFQYNGDEKPLRTYGEIKNSSKMQNPIHALFPYFKDATEVSHVKIFQLIKIEEDEIKKDEKLRLKLDLVKLCLNQFAEVPNLGYDNFENLVKLTALKIFNYKSNMVQLKPPSPKKQTSPPTSAIEVSSNHASHQGSDKQDSNPNNQQVDTQSSKPQNVLVLQNPQQEKSQEIESYVSNISKSNLTTIIASSEEQKLNEELLTTFEKLQKLKQMNEKASQNPAQQNQEDLQGYSNFFMQEQTSNQEVKIKERISSTLDVDTSNKNDPSTTQNDFFFNPNPNSKKFFIDTTVEHKSKEQEDKDKHHYYENMKNAIFDIENFRKIQQENERKELKRSNLQRPGQEKTVKEIELLFKRFIENHDVDLSLIIAAKTFKDIAECKTSLLIVLEFEKMEEVLDILCHRISILVRTIRMLADIDKLDHLRELRNLQALEYIFGCWVAVLYILSTNSFHRSAKAEIIRANVIQNTEATNWVKSEKEFEKFDYAKLQAMLSKWPKVTLSMTRFTYFQEQELEQTGYPELMTFKPAIIEFKLPAYNGGSLNEIFFDDYFNGEQQRIQFDLLCKGLYSVAEIAKIVKKGQKQLSQIFITDPAIMKHKGSQNKSQFKGFEKNYASNLNQDVPEVVEHEGKKYYWSILMRESNIVLRNVDKLLLSERGDIIHVKDAKGSVIYIKGTRDKLIWRDCHIQLKTDDFLQNQNKNQKTHWRKLNPHEFKDIKRHLIDLLPKETREIFFNPQKNTEEDSTEAASVEGFTVLDQEDLEQLEDSNKQTVRTTNPLPNPMMMFGPHGSNQSNSNQQNSRVQFPGRNENEMNTNQKKGEDGNSKFGQHK